MRLLSTLFPPRNCICRGYSARPAFYPRCRRSVIFGHWNRPFSTDFLPRIIQTVSTRDDNLRLVHYSGIPQTPTPWRSFSASAIVSSSESDLASRTASTRYKPQHSPHTVYLMNVLANFEGVVWFHSQKNIKDISLYGGIRNRQPKARPFFQPEDLSLHRILAEYILWKYPDHGLANAIENPWALSAHPAEYIHFLANLNYTVDDLENWSRVLLSASSEEAALRLCNLKDPQYPTFLMLLIFRRKVLSASALRTLLMEIVDALSSDRSGGLKNQTVLTILMVRLLRHARSVWPAALVDIARLFMTTMEKIPSGVSKTPSDHARQRSYIYNRMLNLIALPVKLSPRHSASLQERAQFLLIRGMATHDPPLVINQEGYRALTRVQLAQGKTATEADWARLMALSWPPWKEDKTGMDALRDDDFGISRAGMILRKMQEAGYSLEPVDDVARVYSGWDTDNTPTIQTRVGLNPIKTPSRTWAPGPGLEEKKEARAKRLDKSKAFVDGHLWAARVRATRTMNEAWSIFLRYERLESERPQQEVYLAMLERAVLRKEHLDSQQHSWAGAWMEGATHKDDASYLPGSMKETFPEPDSPNLVTYVDVPPPKSMNRVLERMARANLRPSGRCLTFLLSNTESLEHAFRVLQFSHHGRYEKFSSGDSITLWKLCMHKRTPDYVIIVLAQLMCKLADKNSLKSSNSLWPANVNLPITQQPLIAAAHYLLVNRKLTHRPAWNAVLSSVVLKHGPHQEGPDEYCQMIQDVLNSMASLDVDIDRDAFRYMCYGMQRLTQKSHKKVDLEGLARELRGTFGTLVGTSTLEDSVQLETRLLNRVYPVDLEAYAVALGCLRDFEGLYSLTNWMAEYYKELSTIAQSIPSGNARLRQVLVAIRVFLERLWEEQEARTGPFAPEELTELVKQKVESMAEMGGWPTEMDCAVYCSQGHVRFPST